MSLSVDPTSPYYADQTKMYSAKQWMRWPFCAGQIARDPALKRTLIGGGYRQPRHRG